MERITIVGAGLVGTVLSVYLSRKGYQVDVYDRNPDVRTAPKTAGRAINLTLCDRGLKTLDEIGVGEIVRGISVPCYGRYVHAADGELAFQPYGNKREAIYSISRCELSIALLNFAEQEPNIKFHFNQKCIELSLTPLKVGFKNLLTEETIYPEADRIFGADGTFSAVRMLLQRLGRFNYSQEFLDQGYTELTVPASSQAAWTKEKEVLHMWPRGRYMLLGFPNTDGSFTCSLHMPFEGQPSFESLQTKEDVARFFQEQFPDVVSEIPNLFENFNKHQPNPMVTVRCSPWTAQGKVAIIGDAAHVLFPYYGQGANAGFEDCTVLVRCLEKHGDDWSAAFNEYETLRKPNMNAIADMCVEHYIEIRDLVGTPEFLLRKAIERKVNQMYPDEYLPLYSMIAFSCMPYLEALQIDRRQSSLIDSVMTVEDVAVNLNSPAVENLIRSLMHKMSAQGREHVNVAATEPVSNPYQIAGSF